ncbi:MAG TPA: hypothetical protein VMJ65_07345 [Solirubrobacteraceae bacterium]|nr:hypothetical protein [Solirubrobacteraceae bacterium]
MIAAAVAAGLLELVLLAMWQRNGYWDFSDGVYAESAREFLHGMVPYRDFAAAQPPVVFLVGVVLLSIHDGLASLRAGMALADLATAILVGVCVWRLTGLRGVAVGTALLSPLLPISLHEHAQLTPETLAAPLLLGGALLCARRSRAAVGGVLLALAVMSKLAFAVPALAIALSTRQRREATLSLILASVVFAIASFAAFGVGVWREAVHAQLQVGRASLHYAGGLIAQGAWNELPLVVPAAAGVWLVWTRRERPLDMELMRTVVAAALAGLLLVFTVFKLGSWINVLVVAEPPLLVLAAAGAVWSVRRSRVASIAMGLLGVLLAAQIVSLLADPADPPIANRPGARKALAWTAGPGTVDLTVGIARLGPPTRAYSADPYYAFLSHRRMPGNQPDLFMLQHAPIDAGSARRAAADQPRWP